MFDEVARESSGRTTAYEKPAFGRADDFFHMIDIFG